MHKGFQFIGVHAGDIFQALEQFFCDALAAAGLFSFDVQRHDRVMQGFSQQEPSVDSAAELYADAFVIWLDQMNLNIAVCMAAGLFAGGCRFCAGGFGVCISGRSFLAGGC